MTSVKSQLSAKKQGEVLRLAPKSDLVASTVEGHRASLSKAIENASGVVVLDLVAVEQVDSLGITRRVQDRRVLLKRPPKGE